MDAISGKAFAAFGFLTVLESAEHGLFGGYLVLSPKGRPLEFRCSAPVVASRAQEILYGPTLRAYLFADVIGQSLVADSQVAVEAILTDHVDMLPLAWLRPEEVLYVEPAINQSTDPSFQRVETRGAAGVSFEMGGCQVAAASTSRRDAAQLRQLLEPLIASVYLAEPFDRIRAVLVEAQLASLDAEYDDERSAA